MKPLNLAFALALVTLSMVLEAAEREPFQRHQRNRPDPYDAGADWLQFNDAPGEPPGDVRTVSAFNVDRMRLGWRTKLPEPTDGSAVYVSDVETEWGDLDLVIVLTTQGRLVALDARS